jgi:glycosyltransferase involved in cell wall biosynthesis
MAPAGTDGLAAAPAAGASGRWVSVGRLAPNKALELAIMALLVTRAHDDPGASLQVIGRPVVASYSAALRRFVDDLGLRDAVTFRGALSDAALASAVAGSDVFVLPSRHEGFGVPVVEAMALGVPVVANDAGALPDVVGDGGLLVDAGDPYALAAAVARVRAEPGLRTTLVDAGARRVAALDLPSAGDRAADVIVRVVSGA